MKLAILFLAACGHHDTATPCTKATSHLEVVAVEDSSPYMKTVYTHVGSDRSGRATDADALAAGVSADIDVWSETETKAGMELPGARHIDYFLIGHDRAALEQYLATLAPVPTDRKLVLGRAMPLANAIDRRMGWRTYYVTTTDIIDETSIESATTVEPDHPAVRVKLKPAAQAAFAAATAKTVGHKIAMIVDGIVMTAPIINGEIKGGAFTITMPSTPDANDLLKRLGC